MEIKKFEMSKKKFTKYDSKIINRITPFSTISYDKKKKIDIFIGREEYLRILSEMLFKSVFSDQSFGVSISGPGGCGKSTLFGYLTQLINSQKFFNKSYCQLKKDDCIIITCFIDAPKGEPTTLKYFWTSIIDALAEKNIEFLEKFALMLFIKNLEVLWKSNFKRDDLKSILSVLIPNFEISTQYHSISELVDIDQFFDTFTREEDLTKEIYNIISSGWRILQRYKVTFGLLGKSEDFNQQRTFKFEKKYFDLLFDNLSNEIDKSTRAQNIFKGAEGDLIKSDSDVINLFNWLTQTWEWIEEKPICFLIGVDNIGYLTIDIENKVSAYPPFIQTILQMRNSLKKFLFVLIGTNEDWRLLYEYIRNLQDYRSQLQGFLIRKIDLTRLTLSEVRQALSLIMNKFWTSAGIVNPSNPLYPFSQDFFTYLYDYNAHDYRSILIFLDKIWLYYKSFTRVIPLEEPFKMINFVHDQSPVLSQEFKIPSSKKEIYFSSLIDWEKDKIKKWFVNIKSRHVGKKQSDLVENGLTEAIRIIQQNEESKQIDWVVKTPPISIISEKGKRTRYPDIYVKLIPQSFIDRKRAFEIQVKMYDQDKFVKLNDVKSSLELLESAHTDALLFIMTGAGLEDKVGEEFKKLNLSDRVLYSNPLNNDQFKALTFLIAYEKIFNHKPSIGVIKEILEILFEQPWDDLLERIRNIGSFRDTRLRKEIKVKQKSTLKGFIGPIKAIKNHIEQPQKTSQKIEIPKNIDKVQEQGKLEKKIQEIPKVENKFDKNIKRLGLNDLRELLVNIYNRYKSNLKELKFILDTALNRPTRYKGKTTKDFLKKNVPAHLSDEIISELFLRLKNEYLKKQFPNNELIFTYKGTSIIITEIGKSFSKVLIF
ncbi:MAG: ATP-binding protein [Promethearchaeota archaeon]